MKPHGASGKHHMAILTDVTKCVGCEKCVAACVETNNTGNPIPYIYAHPDGLSYNRWTSIIKVTDEETEKWRFVRKQCLHCEDPACVGACPARAWKKTETGAVVYNPGKCIGCRYCMISCPYKIPRFDWEHSISFISKCILCYERLKEGKKPACTAACPYGATIFGTREEMLAEARYRITMGKMSGKFKTLVKNAARSLDDEKTGQEEDKATYIDRIWGEDDMGGTCVLYISDVPLDDLGFMPADHKFRTKSMTEWTWPVASKTPYLAAGVLFPASAIYWVINRRMKLQGGDGGHGH